MDQVKVRQLFYYDNGILVWRKNNKKAGCLSSRGYTNFIIKGKNYRRHQLVFLYHKGYIPKLIDHRDGDPGNDKIENLRECSHMHNCQNASISKRNTTGYKGVSKFRDRYRAAIMANRKYISLGVFNTKEEAAAAYITASKIYHGKFSAC